MNLKNKETTNCTQIWSFPVKYRFAFHRVNFLTPIRSSLPTGQAEKNRTYREHRATPHPPFLLCLFKTQPTTPKLTMDGHPGKGVHLRPILQGLEVGMRSITDVLGL